MKEVVISMKDIENLFKVYDADKILCEISKYSDEERVKRLFDILIKYKEGNA